MAKKQIHDNTKSPTLSELKKKNVMLELDISNLKSEISDMQKSIERYEKDTKYLISKANEFYDENCKLRDYIVRSVVGL